MLKPSRLLFCVWLLLPVIAVAQRDPVTKTGTVLIPVKDLRLPTAPGLVLLDKAPASVENVTTPQGLGAALLGGLTGQDFTIGVTPYWMANHKNLTFANYVNIGKDYKLHKGDFTGFFRDANVSAAVVTDSLKQQNAGLGLRTNLFRIRTKEGLDSVLKYTNQLYKYDSLITRTNDTAKLKEYSAALKKYRPLAKKAIADFLQNKPLLLISLAGSYAFRLPAEGQLANNDRYGAWIDAVCHPTNQLTAIAVARLQSKLSSEAAKAHRETTYDLGLRLGGTVYVNTGTQKHELLLSGEYLRRFADSGNTYRAAFVGEFGITDSIYLTATYGENFGNNRQTIALLGVNFGLTNDPTLKAAK